MENNDMQKQLKDIKEELNTLKSKIYPKSSPARLKAERKYYKTLTPYSLRFTKDDALLCRHIDSQENKSRYIKELIVRDMGYSTLQDYYLSIEAKRRDMLRKYYENEDDLILDSLSTPFKLINQWKEKDLVRNIVKVAAKNCLFIDLFKELSGLGEEELKKTFLYKIHKSPNGWLYGVDQDKVVEFYLKHK